MKVSIPEDNNHSDSKFAEQLKELQKVNPKYPDRLFDLKEDQVRHEMEMEKRKEENKMKLARFRLWNLIFFRIIFGGMAATLFYFKYEIAAISMLGGFIGTLLPSDLKKYLPGKKTTPPSE